MNDRFEMLHEATLPRFVRFGNKFVNVNAIRSFEVVSEGKPVLEVSYFGDGEVVTDYVVEGAEPTLEFLKSMAVN